MNKEVEVEYLPTLGEPENIKTIKQGRRGSVQSHANGKTFSDLTTRKTIRKTRNNNAAMTEILCHRIIKFSKSSEAQIKLAETYLGKIIFDNMDQHEAIKRKISNVNKWLFKKFKDYRQI